MIVLCKFCVTVTWFNACTRNIRAAITGALDLKQRWAEWSPYDIKVPARAIWKQSDRIALAVLWCHKVTHSAQRCFKSNAPKTGAAGVVMETERQHKTDKQEARFLAAVLLFSVSLVTKISQILNTAIPDTSLACIWLASGEISS